MGIAFKVDYSFKLAIPGLIFTFIDWNFGVSLQYLHLYLPLPIGILGFVAIPTPVLTLAN
jgi:hypothetical protein